MPRIHRIESTTAGLPVNAYLVEGESQVVAIDGTLTVSGGRALQRAVTDTGKPLAAVLITHAHPDHYAGIAELVGDGNAPIVATAGVAAVIERDDALKHQILSPMFGDEWPERRRFPNELVVPGQTLAFGELRFTVLDLGAGESPHDSVWLLGDDRRTVFLGDQYYGRMHCYLADGFWEAWLANIRRLRRELPADATFYPGHGEQLNASGFDWQEGYIETFIAAVREADWSRPDEAKTVVIRQVKTYLPDDDLQLLMELSVEPVAVQLGLTKPSNE